MKKYKISFLIIQDSPLGTVEVEAENEEEAIEIAQKNVESGDIDVKIEDDTFRTIIRYEDFTVDKVKNEKK